jgi:hypothetical protein
VVTKNSIFCDITPCSPLKVNRSFGRNSRLHLQGRRINQARDQREEGSKQRACYLLSWLAYSSTLKMEVTCSSKLRLTFNGLYGGISQKIELFIKLLIILTFSPTQYSNVLRAGHVKNLGSIPGRDNTLFFSLQRPDWFGTHSTCFPKGGTISQE